MNRRRLKGAPTADELGIKGMSAVLYERIMTNHHEGQQPKRILAECNCVQIKAEEVAVGDFRYHYSNQLDTFILWEVIGVDRERMICQVKTIDTDSPEVTTYWDGEQSLVDSFNKFYRPAAVDRARVERAGFNSDYIPLSSFARPTQRRGLSLKLHSFRADQLTEDKPQKQGILHRIGSWLLGY